MKLLLNKQHNLMNRYYSTRIRHWHCQTKKNTNKTITAKSNGSIGHAFLNSAKRSTSTSTTAKSIKNTQQQQQQNPKFDTFLLTLSSRILAGFGILHIFNEYCFEITRCEGPSMMPTIQPSGEIILVEKITHRIYGLNGGDDGHKRAKDSQMKQLEWEKKESRLWLGGGRVGGLEGGKGTSSSTKPSSPSSSKTPSVHTWYESKLKEVNPINYRDLSSLSQCYSKLTSGIAVGDVVVMRHPNRDGTVCKRVLGLPGDIIIRPKKTSSQYYNSFSTMNQRQEQQQKRESHRDVMNVFQNDSDDEKRDKKYSNAKKNAAVDRTSNIISSSSFSCMPSLHNSSLIVIPNGHVWLEGDNSINSSDSRNYGPQPASLVVGKVLMRLWPFSGNALMVRGGCPVPPKGRPFTGSTRLPAGYDGQTIRNID